MKQLLCKVMVLLLVFCFFSCGQKKTPSAPDSLDHDPAAPPLGLKPESVPQFVVFGSDDNGYSGLPESGDEGGMEFLTALFQGRKNPQAAGNARTFDNLSWHYTFFVNTHYLMPQTGDAGPYGGPRPEAPELVREAWLRAIAAGHEVGVHTHTHPHGRDLSSEQWRMEMETCLDILARPVDKDLNAGGGLGLTRDELPGFRTPYLEYSDDTMRAAHALGFRYDCSIEEGMQSERTGGQFNWPYTLDRGSPADPQIGSHKGLWEIPVYVFIVPPDSECERYGVAPGLRKLLSERQEYFNPDDGKITGMDWNLWVAFSMNPAEFLATLRYSLDLHRFGNRCPMTIGLHSELYSNKTDTSALSATAAERRQTLRDFADHLQRLPEVRVVSIRELLQWLQQPQPLGVEK